MNTRRIFRVVGLMGLMVGARAAAAGEPGASPTSRPAELGKITSSPLAVPEPPARSPKETSKPPVYSCSPGAFCSLFAVKGKFSVSVEMMDPLRMVSAAGAVIESAKDAKGLKITLKQKENDKNTPWRSEFTTDVERLSEIKGYFIVGVATKTQDVEMPLKMGEKKTVGDWELEVVNVEYQGNHYSLYNYSSMSEIVLMGLENRDSKSLAKVETLRYLMEFRDDDNHVKKSENGQQWTSQLPRRTVSGGIRQKIDFVYPGAKVDPKQEPTKIVFTVPLEIKEASIPFEFKDVGMER